MLNKQEVLEYAEDCGVSAAADLLLLCGPDGFDGTYDDYIALESLLHEKPEELK